MAVAADLDPRAFRREAARHLNRNASVTARREPGRFTGRVDTLHLHRRRGDPGQAQNQHRHQRRDRQGRLDGAGAGTASQTLVLRARPMMWFNADTTESPVTTV